MVIEKPVVKPQPVVIVADTTFFRRSLLICVFRSPQLKRNLYWQEIPAETIEAYRLARTRVEEQGFRLLAIVLDGKPGIREVFADIPVQMCHFHQKLIITRHITTRPKLEAGQELRALTQSLCRSNEEDFTRRLDEWHAKWKFFLNERTNDPETGRWHYTHKRLRAAYRSLKTNLHYLFTYQKYPELNIPNTTNSLEGTFSRLKDLTTVLRGLKTSRKRKLINEILSN
ncbi:MAG: hypothetical protein M1269_03895 [Chloroflexi bacterium]|nr:hypothetical protein [Chloroflexota bacterium]